MSQKLALIIGNSEYDDTNLAALVTPGTDVKSLAQVLRDPEIGGFDEVTALVNQSVAAIRRAIAGFYLDKSRDDLLLLYFSGHGMRDDRGGLYLAVKDTEHKLLRGTAIPASYITEEMDNSRSRRQVLILDCCHSGAFSRGMKGVTGVSVGTAAAFEGIGSGRVVLTASDSTQYAWEGDQVTGQAESSVFTRYLIQGLRTGEADADADGQITLDELYDYVHDRVVSETPKQTPSKWSYGQQGEIVLAQNLHPVVKLAELPLDLQQTIDDPRPWVRESSVSQLDRLLRGSHRGLAAAAREVLQKLTGDDSRRVAAAAADVLATYPTSQKTSPEIREIPSSGSTGKEGKAEVSPIPRPIEPNRKREERVAGDRAMESRLITSPAAEAEKPELKRGPSWMSRLSAAIDWVLEKRVITIAIASAIGGIILADRAWAGELFAGLILMGLVIGFVTSAVLRHLRPAIGWPGVGGITLGFIAGYICAGLLSESYAGSLADLISNLIDWNLAYVFSMGIFGFIGGTITGAAIGFVLRGSKKSLTGKQLGGVTLAWAIAFGIGWGTAAIYEKYGSDELLGLALTSAISGLIGGAIASSMMFSQLRRGAEHLLTRD